MQQAFTLPADGAGRMPQTPAEAVPSRIPPGGGLPGRASDGGAAAAASLVRAIDRLEEVVDQETTALRRRAQVDLKEFNTRKSHGLLELTRAMRLFEPEALTEALRVRLAALRARLEANRAALAMHLEAAREISTIMAEAMQKAESDGTYSEAAVRAGLRQ
jgi:hypothetical protein